MTTAGVIRVILVIDIVAMAIFALLYLRQRRMRPQDYFLWGMIALLIPVLGPFLVISNRPGAWDPEMDLKQDIRRAGAFFRQVFAARPLRSFSSTTRIERVRLRRQTKEKQRGS